MFQLGKKDKIWNRYRKIYGTVLLIYVLLKKCNEKIVKKRFYNLKRKWLESAGEDSRNKKLKKKRQ